jgi:DNA invertase Pin-like site-specific DNA recombinase
VKAPIRKLRCAVYTRVSTDERLDMEFNSLDAQREAAISYIESQKHEGWLLVADRYDDGGFSGGTMERPGLQRLLRDIECCRIDVIVVYKVDRLSRSLGDFARIVEMFERHAVSFVSVTQQFNTTSSTGRLTLNILLSFAQFEREVIGERIRDKFAASRRKGMWMGGIPPLGYDVVDRKLVVNEREAKLVRLIFSRFLQLGSATELARELRQAGHTTKSWTTQDGKHRPGKPIDKGALYKILNNRVYFGEAVHKAMSYPGEHDAIIDQGTWDKVRAILAENARRRANGTRAQMPALLRGLIFAPGGHAMTPTHSRKAGKLYRYYVATDAIRQGYSECAVRSVPAAEVEEAVVAQVRCCARPRSSRGRGRRRSGRATRPFPSATSSRPSPTWRRCGMSSSRPSRRASSACWSSGSICRPLACRFGYGPTACTGLSRSCGRGRHGRHEDETEGGRQGLGVRRLDDHRPHPDHLEAPRRPKGDHCSRWRRRLGTGETAAGRDSDPRIGAGAPVEEVVGGGEVSGGGDRERREGHAEFRQPTAAAHFARAGYSGSDGRQPKGCSWRS